ncbi:hypothetical protein YC2023_085575 [Brassica napus]|uniref:Uncharacterized protein n=1 Tax=Brassica oleracea TaxID=3712 RepID=A0A3P6EQW7_BRAOL|nr:unnamed protein product [Brassica oleracea]
MMIQNVPDTSSLDYWLNWRVFLCAVWVLTPMIIALFVIWKFEKDSSVETQRPKGSYSEHSEDIWRPSLKQIHPGWLLGFRVLAFCFLLTSNIVRLAFRGFRIYYYYTQWTFTLITIYFRMGSLFSVYGCFQHKKQTCFSLRRYIRPSDSKTLASCVKLFHIIFQTSAGAAVLTDSIYWTVIFPFLSLQDYEMSFLFTFILALTLNIFDSLGHSTTSTILNRLVISLLFLFAFKMFSYFILWTGSFVIFQWLLHVFISVGWPYPFLDLSIPMAPVWYLLVALLHLPSYALYALFVRIKHQFTS